MDAPENTTGLYFLVTGSIKTLFNSRMPPVLLNFMSAGMIVQSQARVFVDPSHIQGILS